MREQVRDLIKASGCTDQGHVDTLMTALTPLLAVMHEPRPWRRAGNSRPSGDVYARALMIDDPVIVETLALVGRSTCFPRWMLPGHALDATIYSSSRLTQFGQLAGHQPHWQHMTTYLDDHPDEGDGWEQFARQMSEWFMRSRSKVIGGAQMCHLLAVAHRHFLHEAIMESMQPSGVKKRFEALATVLAAYPQYWPLGLTDPLGEAGARTMLVLEAGY